MIEEKLAFEMIQSRCDFSLQRHLVHVAYAMRAMHARLKPPETEKEWFLTGLLHDIDWNDTIHDPTKHCGQETADYLRSCGLPDSFIVNIQSHHDYHQIERDSLIRKALVSVDELSGFVVAAALMRPTKLIGMKSSSVIKKMKDKAFARAVNREDMRLCEEYFNIPVASLLTETLLPAFANIEEPWGLNSSTTDNETEA